MNPLDDAICRLEVYLSDERHSYKGSHAKRRKAALSDLLFIESAIPAGANEAHADVARMNWLESRSFVRVTSTSDDIATLRRSTLRESIDTIRRLEEPAA